MKVPLTWKKRFMQQGTKMNKVHFTTLTLSSTAQNLVHRLYYTLGICLQQRAYVTSHTLITKSLS